MTDRTPAHQALLDAAAQLETGESGPHRVAELLRADLPVWLRDGLDPSLQEAVRCTLLRTLPALLDSDQREAFLSASRAALEPWLAASGQHEATTLLARPPSWVGLSALELNLVEGASWGAAVDAGWQAARAGFTSLPGPLPARGNVLWALAETAEEAGWSRRAEQLLAEAAKGPFQEASDRARILLLRGLAAAERGAPQPDLLEAATADADADDRTRVHAAWVLSALGHAPGRLAWLRRAREWADPDEPEVLRRLEEALSEAESSPQQPEDSEA